MVRNISLRPDHSGRDVVGRIAGPSVDPIIAVVGRIIAVVGPIIAVVGPSLAVHPYRANQSSPYSVRSHGNGVS